MAFQTKYSLTWADVEGVTWEIFFQTDPWAGAVTAFTPGVNPCKQRWHGGDKYQPIVGSSVDIQMVYESAIDDLFTEESQSIKVILRRDSTLKWNGFVSPGQYHRMFNRPKHYATITATDGLGELKHIKFEDSNGDPYYGQEEEIVVIANILLKTGHSLDIYEAVSIFDQNHDTGADKSPLNQTYIYQEGYWDEQTDERSSCYEVLEDILRKYGATIRTQSIWFIIRPNLYSLDTFTFRQFNSAGVYESNDSDDPCFDLDSTFYYIHADQEFRKIMGVGFSEITQTPPRRENMFKNGSFDSFTWTAGAADYWTATGLPTYVEDGGALKMDGCATSAIPAKYIESTTSLYYANSVDITLDWTPHYVGSPSFKNLFLQIYDSTAALYLTNAGWRGGVGYYSVSGGTSDEARRVTISFPETIISSGFYRGFSLRVRIYEFHNEGASGANYLHLDNLRLEVDMDIPDNKIHSYTNPVSINSNAQRDMALGDSWRRDFFPAGLIDDAYYVSTYTGDTELTSLWSITGDPTAAAPISELLARQTVEGFRRGIDELTGTFRSVLTPFGRIGIRDANIVDEFGFTKSFFPTDVTLDTKLNEAQGTWLECPATYTDEEMEWASHDMGGDATITGKIIEINNWTSPGVGDFAYFDEYTAVVGETVRTIVNFVDDGSSSLPRIYINNVQRPRAWGLNYYTDYFSTAGAKIFELGDQEGGNTFNCTVTIDVYSITGI